MSTQATIFPCPNCRREIELDGSGRYRCTECWHVFDWPPRPAFGKVVKKRQLVGWFSILELIGWGSIIAGAVAFEPFMFIFGIAFALIGGRLSVKCICSECGNKVEKTSKLCPTCKAHLG